MNRIVVATPVAVAAVIVVVVVFHRGEWYRTMVLPHSSLGGALVRKICNPRGSDTSLRTDRADDSTA